jgi:protocatechuate 3,4-dioxygenase, beta subunit
MRCVKINNFYAFLLLFVLTSCSKKENAYAQKASPSPLKDKEVGGGCEGCDLYKIGMPSNLIEKTTIPEPHEKGEKLIIEGYIYQKDGKTPAPDVILYLYHTTDAGYYTPSSAQPQASKRHGRLRGWVKSRADGYYQFTTIRPAPYPNENIPAHIHPTIKETGKTPYYIDDYVFEDDVFVTGTYRKKQQLRCGSGIMTLTKGKDGTWHGKRNLILGLNIPNY